MEKELDLLPRIEEKRDKKNIRQVVEFDLNEIKSHFDENIADIENNYKFVDKLEQINEIDGSKNILRSQIVALVSCLDFYMHELNKYVMVKMFNGEWEKTDRYNKIKIEIKYIDEAINNPESHDWFLKYINMCIMKVTYASFESIKEQLHLLGLDFERIKEEFDKINLIKEKNDLSLNDLLKKLFSRRNEIAHQSDRNHYDATYNEIAKEYVIQNVNYIKCFVDIIHNLAIEKL